MRIMHFYDPPKTAQHSLIQLNLGPVRCVRASGDMVGRCMPNSGRGGCSGTEVMTIVVSYVALHFPNIGYLKVYGSI